MAQMTFSSVTESAVCPGMWECVLATPVWVGNVRVARVWASAEEASSLVVGTPADFHLERMRIVVGS